MNTGKRMLIAAAAVLSMGLGAGVALVAAHTTTTPSEVGISTTSNGMTGALVGQADSPDERCYQDRKVLFLRDKPSGKDPVVGKAKTGNNGLAFRSYPNGLDLDFYYAKMKKTFLKRSAQHKHICGKAQSEPNSFMFPDPNP